MSFSPPFLPPSATANYAWVNRSSMTFLCRQAFAKVFQSTPDDLDMHVVYDVSHNIAKVRECQLHRSLVSGFAPIAHCHLLATYSIVTSV